MALETGSAAAMAPGQQDYSLIVGPGSLMAQGLRSEYPVDCPNGGVAPKPLSSLDRGKEHIEEGLQRPISPPVIRPRTAQACDKCRERKTKCSGERPTCMRCSNRGLICHYSARNPRARAPSVRPLARMDSSREFQRPSSPLRARRDQYSFQGSQGHAYNARPNHISLLNPSASRYFGPKPDTASPQAYPSSFDTEGNFKPPEFVTNNRPPSIHSSTQNPTAYLAGQNSNFELPTYDTTYAACRLQSLWECDNITASGQKWWWEKPYTSESYNATSSQYRASDGSQYRPPDIRTGSVSDSIIQNQRLQPDCSGAESASSSYSQQDAFQPCMANPKFNPIRDSASTSSFLDFANSFASAAKSSSSSDPGDGGPRNPEVMAFPSRAHSER